jgi:hypothetical protein
MGMKDCRSRWMRLLVGTVVLWFVVLTACQRADESTDASANSKAIASIVQTVNAAATQAGKSPLNTPTILPAAVPTRTPAPTLPPAPAPTASGESFERSIRFSGQDWKVKNSGDPVGPGPNYFSNSPESVWVDENGQLHLHMIHKDGRWYCAEVVTAEPLGYGSYQFKIISGAANLDPYVVIGLFTWDTGAPQYHYREIDVELSRWLEETELNTQFVVQPWDHSGNRHRFAMDPQADSSTHIFNWSPKSVQFLSFLGSAQSPDPNSVVEQWTYTGPDTPPAGGAVNARINLWLNGGHAPANGLEIEVVLSSFEFIPQAPAQ